MSTEFLRESRGSLWRKWDLHVHTPSTKMNDGYKLDDGSDVWNSFCEKLEKSDVQVFGITDYFSCDNFQTLVDKFRELYPHSEKVFFPNIELRLNETVNRAVEEIHIHAIFNPNSLDKAKSFLGKLKTIKTDHTNRQLTCDELKSTDFESVTVTRSDIMNAIRDTFGENSYAEHLVLVTAANNDGIRSNGQQRKNLMTDEIDKMSDGFFGGSQNVEYFLSSERLSRDEYIRPKFVLAGSDAHSFDDIDNWLGKDVNTNTGGQITKQKEVTWIKANPTFDGFRQIIFEPSSRVKLGGLKPDSSKPAYAIIDHVEYTDVESKKQIVYFNNNLNSIIGARASGKSTLLKNIAFSVDYKQCKKRDVSDFFYLEAFKLFWADGSTDSLNTAEAKEKGILMIPQSYLGNIVYENNKNTGGNFDDFLLEVFNENSDFRTSSANYEVFESQNSIELDSLIRDAVIASNELERLNADALKIGKEADIAAEITSLTTEITRLNEGGLVITAPELKVYDELTENLRAYVDYLKIITGDIESLSSIKNAKILDASKVLEYSFSLACREKLVKEIESSDNKLREGYIKNELQELEKQKLELEKQIKETDKKLLPYREKLAGNKSLEELTRRKQENEVLKAKIVALKDKAGDIRKSIKDIQTLLSEKYLLFEKQFDFYGAALKSTGLEFSSVKLVSEFDTASLIQYAKNNLNYHNSLEFKGDVAYTTAEKMLKNEEFKFSQAELGSLLTELADAILYKKLRLKDSTGGDIGGVLTGLFKNRFKIDYSSSISDQDGTPFYEMSDGQKMVVLLELIFCFDDHLYPILIDQPEDDLDSRAVAKDVLTFLHKQKSQRQVIIVSHNANLVVCGDSEEVIVAEKKTKNNFNYSTGAIEDRKILADIVSILEGGEKALQKRQQKYGI